MDIHTHDTYNALYDELPKRRYAGCGICKNPVGAARAKKSIEEARKKRLDALTPSIVRSRRLKILAYELFREATRIRIVRTARKPDLDEYGLWDSLSWNRYQDRSWV